MFLARQALPHTPLIEDRRPPPDICGAGGAPMAYADNALHMGADPAEVEERRLRLSAVVNGCGLDTHEIVEAATVGSGLGVRFNGVLGTLSASPSRDWDLDQSLLALDRRSHSYGRRDEKSRGPPHLPSSPLQAPPLSPESCVSLHYFHGHGASTGMAICEERARLSPRTPTSVRGRSSSSLHWRVTDVRRQLVWI